MSNCVPDPDPDQHVIQRNQFLRDELKRRANEARKKLEAR
jgi:hypothetical protein